MNKKAAEFHAQIFLRERQISQKRNHIVAILNPICSSAGGHAERVSSRGRVGAVHFRGVGSAKPKGNLISRKKCFGTAGIVSDWVVIKYPDAREI